MMPTGPEQVASGSSFLQGIRGCRRQIGGMLDFSKVARLLHQRGIHQAWLTVGRAGCLVDSPLGGHSEYLRKIRHQAYPQAASAASDCNFLGFPRCASQRPPSEIQSGRNLVRSGQARGGPGLARTQPGESAPARTSRPRAGNASCHRPRENVPAWKFRRWRRGVLAAGGSAAFPVFHESENA